MGKKMEETLDRMMDAYREGKVSRRDFMKYLGIAGAAAGLVGGPFGMARKAFGAKSITFHSWGGSTSEALRKYAFEPFEKETGIEVVDAAFTGMDAFLTQVKASYPPGGEFNIAHLSAVFDYARYTDLGFSTVLDESKIPNLKLVMTSMIKPLRDITNGTLSAVPYDLGQTGIAYNTKHVSKEKAEKLGASLLWDKELKGKPARKSTPPWPGPAGWRPSSRKGIPSATSPPRAPTRGWNTCTCSRAPTWKWPRSCSTSCSSLPAPLRWPKVRITRRASIRARWS